jgi:hypothetical protein
MTPIDGSDMGVRAAARDVADAAAALSRLQQNMARGTEPVNRPVQKANYLFAHEHLRNARRRHAKALDVNRGRPLRADTPGQSDVPKQSVEARAADIRHVE